MNRGQLIALDTPGRLKHGLTEQILEVRTRDGARAAEALAQAPGVIQAGMFGRAVHAAVRDPELARASIRQALAAEAVGLDNPELPEIEPSLEDVFIALVRAAGGAPSE